MAHVARQVEGLKRRVVLAYRRDVIDDWDRVISRIRNWNRHRNLNHYLRSRHWYVSVDRERDPDGWGRHRHRYRHRHFWPRDRLRDSYGHYSRRRRHGVRPVYRHRVGHGVVDRDRHLDGWALDVYLLWLRRDGHRHQDIASRYGDRYWVGAWRTWDHYGRGTDRRLPPRGRVHIRWEHGPRDRLRGWRRRDDRRIIHRNGPWNRRGTSPARRTLGFDTAVGV